MSQADDIRQFVVVNYIAKARSRFEQQVSVRAGDVHRDMTLQNAMPAVCSAIGSNKFELEANVREAGRSGPANSSTSTFTFALLDQGEFGVAIAEAAMRLRYGSPDVDSKKMVSFHTLDGRAIALQRDIEKVQVWLEDDGRSAPKVDASEKYDAIRGRHSNLPDRLTDKPSAAIREMGFPVNVLSLRVKDISELRGVLDWYENRSNFDKDALEKLKDAFIARYPDFAELGFSATHGAYWDNLQRHQKALEERGKEIFDRYAEIGANELGDRLLRLLADIEVSRLGLRVTNRLRDIQENERRLIGEAVAELVKSDASPPLAVATFVTKFWPVYSEGQVGNMPYNDARTIPTTLLAICKPAHAMPVRYQPIYTAGMRLLHRSLIKNAPFSAIEYGDILSMCTQILEVMRNDWGWHPRDFWDVQGFIWATCNTSDGTGAIEVEQNMSVDKVGEKMGAPTNLILYGPPGTGKTFATAEKAVELCDGSVPAGGREAVMKRYRDLVDRKRISFVTFHQSYGYEDFVEGLRPEAGGNVEGGDSTNSGGFSLRPHAGVFRQMAELARENRGRVTASPALDQTRQVFKMSLGRSSHKEDTQIYRESIEGSYVVLGWGGEVDWSAPEYSEFNAIKARWQKDNPGATGYDPNITQLYALRAGMKIGDLVIISDGNRRFRAIGEITGPYRYVLSDTGEYNHRRPVKWLWQNDGGQPRELIYRRGFSQVSAYQLDSKQINWPALEQIVAGGGNAVETIGGPEPYVLIIDEINRANVSKVFGELITLIEPDKRLGSQNALTVTLPYSGELFGVPSNLHIVGTMNTADRSIALLDTALRRRFEFVELMPDPFRLDRASNATNIDLVAVLTGLNARIEYLFDRDHQIGHAFFIECRDRGDLDRVMRTKVVPLLVEYFYENWEKVRQVLGESSDSGGFVSRTKLDPPKGADAFLSEDSRWRYQINAEFRLSAYDQLKL